MPWYFGYMQKPDGNVRISEAEVKRLLITKAALMWCNSFKIASRDR
jgi:hypothetical protein